MNKIEKQRMSLKSRSLVSSDSKRAAKSVSCMRNGKVPLVGGNASAPKAPSASEEESPSAAEELAERKASSPASLAMKQEPEDEEGCDDYEYEDAASLLQQESEAGATSATGGSRSAGGHYPMLTRVRSHSRSLRAMANPSAVWAHFDLCSNDPLRAQCRICGAVVVRGGANPRQCGTTNLHRHLRVHHGGRLIGRRYHVMSSFAKQEEQTSASKALRLATQNIVRQMRNIAPAPLSQQQRPKQQQQQQQQQQQAQQQPQNQQSPQSQPQSPSQPQQPQQQPQQQQQRTMKTLVLKTIPLKMKHITPASLKMPSIRPGVPNVQALPQTILPQQPTEVCLRWNSYHSNMQHSFPSLLDSEQFVDVTLACEGRSLKCHKMILSSCSDYLAQLLRENPCQHPIILMKDLKFWEVEALVKFMYRGEVNVTHDKLPQLLNAAEALQVKGLAGPSNSQNPKPPLLIPQAKVAIPRPTVSRQPEESKENKPSTSSEASVASGTVLATSTPSLLKRGQKRRVATTEVPEARPFTKIRLQRPTSPHTQRQGASSPIVKVEPLDIPLSPGDDIIYHALRRDLNDDDDSCSSTAVVDKLVMHEEDDPGGEDIELADPGSDYDNNDDSRNNYAEEQMEFVPTDFLDQEQDIVEDPEDQTNCSTQFTDEDSKQNNEEEDDEDEEDEEAEKSEEESRPSRTKKDKT